MRGCLKSPGGRGIIVMEATARKGAVSRIVPNLSGGSSRPRAVTPTRSLPNTVLPSYAAARFPNARAS